MTYRAWLVASATSSVEHSFTATSPNKPVMLEGHTAIYYPTTQGALLPARNQRCHKLCLSNRLVTHMRVADAMRHVPGAREKPVRLHSCHKLDAVKFLHFAPVHLFQCRATAGCSMEAVSLLQQTSRAVQTPCQLTPAPATTCARPCNLQQLVQNKEHFASWVPGSQRAAITVPQLIQNAKQSAAKVRCQHLVTQCCRQSSKGGTDSKCSLSPE